MQFYNAIAIVHVMVGMRDMHKLYLCYLEHRCRMHVEVYRRSGFDCVVKRLRMALYKTDCDSNDCELPSGQVISNCVFFFQRFF